MLGQKGASSGDLPGGAVRDHPSRVPGAAPCRQADEESELSIVEDAEGVMLDGADEIEDF